jgi:hypothetical protein
MGPFDIIELNAALENTLRAVSSNNSDDVAVSFPNLNKWFQENVVIGLSRVRRAILQQKQLHVRRFLWVALAETVRLSSNSRISTVKLHIRDQKDISSRKINVLETFERVARANIADLLAFGTELRSAGHLRNANYKRSVQVSLGDSSVAIPAPEDSFDLLVTSPPYGDNVTTVTYGQHSYLPLQWIEHSDIDDKMAPCYLATTHEIDSRSLGGSRRVDDVEIAEIGKSSVTFAQTCELLSQKQKDGRSRVASFVRDLDSAIAVIQKVLKPNALMIWTVGNRKVSGIEVPTDRIMSELLLSKKALLVSEIGRPIPSKRMAVRNNVSTTIKSETVLVARKVN